MNVGFRVLRRAGGPDPRLVERFADFSSADISDAMNKAGTMVAIKTAYTPVPRIVGSAITVAIPTGSLQMMKMAMQRTQPGDILVVSAVGVSHAVWGGNLSHGMKKRGVLGVVIDGAARDIADTRADEFPVFCKAIATASASPSGPGEVNVPVACGGVVVNPGDIVVADEDGVVVVPLSAGELVLEKLTDLRARMAGLQPILERGEVTGIAQIEKDLAAQGCEIAE